MLAAEEIARLKEFFKGDRFAVGIGCEILDADDHYGKVGLKITPEHRNAWGGIMGGAIFTAADFAFAIASNQNGEKSVASGLNVNFVGNTQDDYITAEARCIKNGRRTSLYEIEVLDSKGKQIAYLTANGFRLE